MKRIEDIDKNFKVETNLNLPDIKFYDAESEPFKIYGLIREGDCFKRLPGEIASGANEGVQVLSTHSAGGRLRFKTTSPYVAISVETIERHMSVNMCLIGCCGFDMYVKTGDTEIYSDSFAPPADFGTHSESVKHFGNNDLKEITINFPPYHSVKKLYIGLREGAEVYPPENYDIKKPFVYYGSSITQGGCASRPGLSYENIICRRFSADYLNLGFSGSAKGEEILAEYIKNLDMSLFIYDYDHNAPNAEYLEKTHEKFFKIIRGANPELPIVIMTAPIYEPDQHWEERKEVIRKTYENAKANGDKNVYFIDGKDLMAFAKNEGTVDNCHPNDLGFYSMAETLGAVIEKILAK